MKEIDIPQLIGSLIGSLLPLLIVTLLAWRHYGKSQHALSQKYLTFWPRLLASCVDDLVLWPISFCIPIVLTKAPPMFISYSLFFVLSTAWYIYSIWLIAKFGQTVGKMVCKVKVVDFKTEGNIGLKQAILRDLIPILVLIPLLVYQTLLIFNGELNLSNLYDPKIIFEGGKLQLTLMFWVPMGWNLAELITMLTNKQRRALHDYIAGTVVIRTVIREG